MQSACLMELVCKWGAGCVGLRGARLQAYFGGTWAVGSGVILRSLWLDVENKSHTRGGRAGWGSSQVPVAPPPPGLGSAISPRSPGPSLRQMQAITRTHAYPGNFIEGTRSFIVLITWFQSLKSWVRSDSADSKPALQFRPRPLPPACRVPCPAVTALIPTVTNPDSVQTPVSATNLIKIQKFQSALLGRYPLRGGRCGKDVCTVRVIFILDSLST